MRKQFPSRVRSIVLGGLVLTWAVLAPASARDSAAPEDVFNAKGLSKVGAFLVTAQEAEIHSAANSVRTLKSKVATETLARANMSRAINTATDILHKFDSQLTSLDEQMNRVKGNPGEYNKLVDPFNAIQNQFKQRKAALDELRKKLGKIEDSQGLYSDAAIAAAQKAESELAIYADLAMDPELKAAIDRYNKGAERPVKLGPSGTFSIDVAFLKKCVGDMAADGIPVRMDGGIPVVEVVINGKTHEMVWDSGASDVSLSAETAAELDLHATDKDRTVPTFLADGSKVECKGIVIPLIRVGAFTAENVECVIHPPGKVRGPDLLGGSFQHHFICRLDQQAGVLHLTPVDKTAARNPPLVAVIRPDDKSAPVSPPVKNPTKPAPEVKLPDPSPAPHSAVSGRLAIPDPASQAKTERIVRDVFGDYFATSDAVRAGIAAKIIEQAAASSDDPVARYVLLKDAAGLAASVGDAATAMRAAALIDASFAIDGGEFKFGLLRCSANAATGEAARGVLDEGVKLIDEAVAVGNYDLANSLVVPTEQAARNTRDLGVLLAVQKGAAVIQWMQLQAAHAKSAEEILARTPNDPQANLDLGRFLCFVRGDWNGLRHLSKVSDPGLKAAALADLANPAAVEQQVAVGDLWWELAEKDKEGMQKGLRRRAGYWHAQAAASPKLVGLSRALVEKRLGELPPPAPGRVGPAGDSSKRPDGSSSVTNGPGKNPPTAGPATSLPPLSSTPNPTTPTPAPNPPRPAPGNPVQPRPAITPITERIDVRWRNNLSGDHYILRSDHTGDLRGAGTLVYTHFTWEFEGQTLTFVSGANDWKMVTVFENGLASPGKVTRIANGVREDRGTISRMSQLMEAVRGKNLTGNWKNSGAAGESFVLYADLSGRIFLSDRTSLHCEWGLEDTHLMLFGEREGTGFRMIIDLKDGTDKPGRATWTLGKKTEDRGTVVRDSQSAAASGGVPSRLSSPGVAPRSNPTQLEPTPQPSGLALPKATLVRTIPVLSGSVLSMVLADGGKKIVLTNTEKLFVLDAASGDAIGSPVEYGAAKQQFHQAPDLKIDAKGRYVLALSDHNDNLHVFDMTTMAQVGPTVHPGRVLRPAISPDGSQIAAPILRMNASPSTAASSPAAPSIEKVVLYNAADGKPTGFELNPGVLTASVCYSPDGKWILTAASGGASSAQVWNATGAAVSSLARYSNSVMATAIFSPQGDRVASLDRRGRLVIWEPMTAKILQTIDLGTWGQVLAFSPDGTRIAGGGPASVKSLESRFTACQVYDVATGKPITGLLENDPGPTFAGTEHGMVFSANRRYLLTHSGYGRSARLWDLNNGGALAVELEHPAQVREALFTRDGGVITSCVDGQVRIWRLPPDVVAK